MQDLPQGHMGNSDMSSDSPSPHTGSGMVLYQVQDIPVISLSLARHSNSSFTFLCVHDEEFAVGQSVV
ncbi:hypothetical protein TNCV_4768821 [Trichonephila clavipes]|nr:hypothetical protein TNCV_4768821 [Trichonephila clavipes]